MRKLTALSANFQSAPKQLIFEVKFGHSKPKERQRGKVLQAAPCGMTFDCADITADLTIATSWRFINGHRLLNN